MLTHLSLAAIIEMALIVGLAGFIQGFSGFAYGLISLPLLSLIFPPLYAVGMVSVSGILIIAYNTWLHRRYVRLKPILALVLYGAILVPVGAFFVGRLPENGIYLGIGCVVIALAVLDLLTGERSLAVFSLRWVAVALSGLAGLLGGAFSTPGPAIIAYIYGKEPSRMVAKAEVQLYFLLLSIFVIVAQALRGTIRAGNTVMALMYLPVILLAVTAGARLSFVVPPKGYRTMTSVLLIVVGIAVALRSLSAMILPHR